MTTTQTKERLKGTCVSGSGSHKKSGQRRYGPTSGRTKHTRLGIVSDSPKEPKFVCGGTGYTYMWTKKPYADGDSLHDQVTLDLERIDFWGRTWESYGGPVVSKC